MAQITRDSVDRAAMGELAGFDPDSTAEGPWN
jgi:hypothetical protein